MSLIAREDLPQGFGTAVISDDKAYRYLLTRGPLDVPYVLFVMLNPSTADATVDDATIKWCWSWTMKRNLSLRVVNLFAYRARDPKVLRRVCREGFDIVGPENDRHIRYEARNAELVVCGWGGGDGIFGKTLAAGRDYRVMQILRESSRPHFLRRSVTTGSPWHPLYLPRDTEAVSYHFNQK